DLIDPGALEDVEAYLRGSPRSPDELHDVLRRTGDLRIGEYDQAFAEPLVTERRAVVVRVAGEERLIAAEDAGRYRDALGAGLPAGLPDVFLEPVDDPLGSLLGRWARTHPPFTSGEPAARFGLPVALVEDLLARRADSGLLLRGEFRPDGSERGGGGAARSRRRQAHAVHAAGRRCVARPTGRGPSRVSRARPSARDPDPARCVFLPRAGRGR